MERFDTTDPDEFFDVLGGTDRSQGATMTLAPGQSTGGPENAHAASDQWLYVVSGTGRATVEGESSGLRPGTLVLIEAGIAFLGFHDVQLYSWGATISDGLGRVQQAWWISTVPGLALVGTILSLKLVGDGLRDALDPRGER